MPDDLKILAIALYPIALFRAFAYLFIRRTHQEQGWSRSARRQRLLGPRLVLLPVALFGAFWLLRGATS